MEILIIILLIILLLMDGYIILFDLKRAIQPENKPMKPKLTKEEKDKQEHIKKSFENLMNYDEKIARSRK